MGVFLWEDLDEHLPLTDATFIGFLKPCVHEIAELTREKRPSIVFRLTHGAEYTAPDRLVLYLDSHLGLRFSPKNSRDADQGHPNSCPPTRALLRGAATRSQCCLESRPRMKIAHQTPLRSSRIRGRETPEMGRCPRG